MIVTITIIKAISLFNMAIYLRLVALKIISIAMGKMIRIKKSKENEIIPLTPINHVYFFFF